MTVRSRLLKADQRPVDGAVIVAPCRLPDEGMTMQPRHNFLIGCVRDPMMVVALIGCGLLLGIVALWRVALWLRHPEWRRRKADDCLTPVDRIGPLRLEARRRSRANGR